MDDTMINSATEIEIHIHVMVFQGDQRYTERKE